MSRFAVILPAAGGSRRFGRRANDPLTGQRSKKPFVELKGRPVWVRAAEVFANRDDVAQLLIVIAPDDVEFFKEKFQANLAFMAVEIVAGGAERMDSVRNALARVKSDVDYVAVHDAARPLIVKKWIDEVFVAAEETGAAIPAVEIASTIKRVDGQTIEETVPRANLWAAQTPQVFRRDLLLDAFAKWPGGPATDEAQMVEQLGHPVEVVRGWPMNIKITTQGDFKMAEALVNALPQEKPLGGLHPFANERFL
ncbi:MAG: 2-C-methyl-D-erythritol 4-phosphate cytidylyltransferase [Planctomycetota bacterium]|nr:MAG: 2-C-methyl-D-erythritol 4-phosphate cytidylyltransferase [Planctomycetota bacterium]